MVASQLLRYILLYLFQSQLYYYFIYCEIILCTKFNLHFIRSNNLIFTVNIAIKIYFIFISLKTSPHERALENQYNVPILLVYFYSFNPFVALIL